MAISAITEKDLRIWAMDKPELNTLLDGVRFNSEDVMQAQIHVVDYYNTISPPLMNNYTVETFPFRYLMLVGVWGHLLRGAAINQASNQLTYSASGASVNDNDKAQAFASLGNQYWSEFREMAQQLKINENIANVYGVKHSEYRSRAYL